MPADNKLGSRCSRFTARVESHSLRVPIALASIHRVPAGMVVDENEVVHVSE
jgi:hypothetical protein